MDIHFQDGPEKINLSKEDLKKVRITNPYPRDEKFIELYKRYLSKDGVELDDTIIAVSKIKPFSSEVEVPENHIAAMMEAIKNGQKPEIYVYREGDKYILSDDYPVYMAYVFLGWKKVPVSVLVEED